MSARLKPHVFYSRQLILEFSFRSQYKTRSCKIGYIFELSPPTWGPGDYFAGLVAVNLSLKVSRFYQIQVTKR